MAASFAAHLDPGQRELSSGGGRGAVAGCKPPSPTDAPPGQMLADEAQSGAVVVFRAIAKAKLKLALLAWRQEASQKAPPMLWLTLGAQQDVVDALDVHNVGADVEGEREWAKRHRGDGSVGSDEMRLGVAVEV